MLLFLFIYSFTLFLWYNSSLCLLIFDLLIYNSHSFDELGTLLGIAPNKVNFYQMNPHVPLFSLFFLLLTINSNLIEVWVGFIFAGRENSIKDDLRRQNEGLY